MSKELWQLLDMIGILILILGTVPALFFTKIAIMMFRDWFQKQLSKITHIK